MKLSALHNMPIAIWGGGRDGRAATERCLHQGCSIVLISDSPESDVSSQQLAAEFSLNLYSPDFLEGANIHCVVRSPGISKYRPEIHRLTRRGIQSSNLFALWLADQPPNKVIGVTGTKGKSTTATLIERILRVSGKSVSLVGNIGIPVTNVDPLVDCVVVEVSSYQASDCTTSPEIGVLTTLGEDHITWHGSLDRYHHDKLNLFAHPELKKMVWHHDDLIATNALHRLSLDDKHFASPFSVDAILRDSRASGALSHMGSTTFPRNLTLAISAAYAFDSTLTVEIILDAIEDMTPLPSRQNHVQTINGIECIDDALASNPMATLSAVERFSDRPMVLIVGGEDRTVDYSHFIEAVNAHAHVRHVVVMGGTHNSFAEKISTALIRVVRSPDDEVENAFQQALQLAEPGWRIVFSPAAPTPSYLGDYTTRSHAFRQAIEQASSLS